MTVLTHTIHQAADLGGATALIYTTTIAVTALTAVLAPTPGRRRAARDVLALLLRRSPTRP